VPTTGLRPDAHVRLGSFPTDSVASPATDVRFVPKSNGCPGRALSSGEGTDLPDKQSENRACVSCANCPSCQSVAGLLDCRNIQISSILGVIPARHEGRTRRHERGAGCDGRRPYRLTSDWPADGGGVWSWHPWAGAKSAEDHSAGDGDYKVTDTGGSTHNAVNTIAQGRPGRSG
jgi:hypothetical protein